MSARCKYGKLKSPTKGRRCRKRRTTSKRARSTKRRSSRRSRGLKIAGISVGTLGLLAVAGVAAYKFIPELSA